MAGGTIVLAHNSGGPKLDIVCKYDCKETGFLADDVTSYADAMHAIFNMTHDERTLMQETARQAVLQFSEQNFEDCFIDCVQNFKSLSLWQRNFCIISSPWFLFQIKDVIQCFYRNLWRVWHMSTTYMYTTCIYNATLLYSISHKKKLIETYYRNSWYMYI